MTKFKTDRSANLVKPVGMEAHKVASAEKMCAESDLTKEVTLEEEVEVSAKPQSRSEMKPRRGDCTDFDEKDAQAYATQIPLQISKSKQ
jgi:hypothetical protein